jgi:hypothetical protein
MTLTQIATLSVLGYVTYKFFYPSRAAIDPEDVLSINPIIVPTGTIPQIVNTPEKRAEVDAGIVQYQWEIQHGAMRVPGTNRLAGAQYY